MFLGILGKEKNPPRKAGFFAKWKMIDNRMKPLLREAFKGEIPEELRMRRKVVFHKGAHSDFLKEDKANISQIHQEIFKSNNVFFNRG